MISKYPPKDPRETAKCESEGAAYLTVDGAAWLFIKDSVAPSTAFDLVLRRIDDWFEKEDLIFRQKTKELAKLPGCEAK